MAFFFVLIAIEALLLFLTAPLRVRVKGYFCLDRKCALADVAVAGITVLKIKLFFEKEQVRMLINGKNVLDGDDVGRRFGNIPRVLEKAAEYEIFRSVAVSLALGGAECSDGAVGCIVAALAGMLLLPPEQPKVFWDREKQRFDAEIKLGLRVSLLQTLFLTAAAGKKKSA